MKLIMALFISLAFIMACGGSDKTAKAPTPPKAPWETMGDAGVVYSTAPFSCGAATEALKSILSWEVVSETPTTGDLEGGSIRLYTNTETMQSAMVLLLPRNGALVPVMAVLDAAGMQFTMLDFYVVKSFLDNTFDENNMFANATGEYFCFISE